MSRDYNVDELFLLLTKNSKANGANPSHKEINANCNYSLARNDVTASDCNDGNLDAIVTIVALNDAEAAILHYVFPVLVILGVFSNVLLFLPMFRLSKRTIQLCNYCVVFSISHTLTLLIWPAAIDSVVRLFSGGMVMTPLMQSLRNVSDGMCQWLLFVEHFLRQCNRWLFVCLLADCCVVTVRPPRLRTLHRTHVFDIIALVVAVLCLFNAQFFWTHSTRSLNETRECSISLRNLGGRRITEMQANFVMKTVWTVESLLPLLAVFVLLLVIMVWRMRKKLLVASANQQRAIRPATGSLRPTLRQVSVKIMAANRFVSSTSERLTEARGLILNAETVLELCDTAVPTLAIIYIVCELPGIIVYLFSGQEVVLDDKQLAVQLLLGVVAMQIELLYFSMPLVVFIATVRSFRKDSLNLFRKLIHKKKRTFII